MYGTAAVKLTRTKIASQPPIALKKYDLEQPQEVQQPYNLELEGTCIFHLARLLTDH